MIGKRFYGIKDRDNHHKPRKYKREMANRRYFLQHQSENGNRDEISTVDMINRNIQSQPVKLPSGSRDQHKVEFTEDEANKARSKVVEENSNCDLPVKEVVKTQSTTSVDLLSDEYTLGQLLDMNIRQIPYLIENLIPKESIVILGGPSDTGKSTLYSQLALAIINGDDNFLGLKINAIQGRVLIISTEDGSIAVSFRLIRQSNSKIVDSKIRNNLLVKFGYDNLEERIDAILKKMPVDLVIIDAFGDVFEENINSSNNTRRFLNKYKDIIHKFHCSVLIVHHVTKVSNKQKAEKDQLLGSVGIEGKARNVLMLSIVNDQHNLKIVKGNYLTPAEKVKPIYLDFNETTLTFAVTDEPKKSIEPDENSVSSMSGSRSKGKPGRKRDMNLYNQVIKLYKEGVPQVKIAERLDINKSKICRWIKEYRQDEGNDPLTEDQAA